MRSILCAIAFGVSLHATLGDDLERPPAPRRIYLDEFRPTSELKAPQHLLKRAKFPCINVHSHPGRLSDKQIDEMVRVMDASNIAVSVSLD